MHTKASVTEKQALSDICIYTEVSQSLYVLTGVYLCMWEIIPRETI